MAGVGQLRRREGNVRTGCRGGEKSNPVGPCSQGELVGSGPEYKGSTGRLEAGAWLLSSGLKGHAPTA